jgi:DNA replication protein DnaC
VVLHAYKSRESRLNFGVDPTLADGILDRLVHNAHRIEMRGDSMRKNRGKANA